MWAIERPVLYAIGAAMATTAIRAQPIPRAGVLPPPPPAAHAPRIDALPRPAVPGLVDLATLARGLASEPAGLPSHEQPHLLIFISLAMPEPTLTRLVDQARRTSARLVLRGMAEGSITKTALRVRQLLGDRPVAVQIDPRLFDRYAVDRVPTFVLERSAASASPCSDRACATDASHVALSGDVSLDYALRQIRDRAPAFAKQAADLLAQLER